MAEVVVSRQDGNRYWVATYLVDYWCLGVKDVMPPRLMGPQEYEMMKTAVNQNFAQPFVPLSVEQAQSIIYGAVDYAQALGLSPSSHFNTKAQVHFGGRLDGLLPLQFGRDGKPYYIAGPYDDAEKIVATLEKAVGRGNFHFIMPIVPTGLDDLPLLK